jgi:predicted lipoprotein
LGLIENECNGDPCPADVESPYSRNSRENIKNNLLAFQRLFLGGDSGPNADGLGFDDYLESVGEENIATVMGTDIADALESVSDSRFSDDSLYQALQTNVSSVEGAHDATKKVTDRLKNEFIQVLGLSIPDTVGGDTD